MDGAEPWFSVEHAEPGVVRIGEPFVDPWFSANIWLVAGRDCDLLVDTGMGLAPLGPLVARLTARPVLAVATHVHLDHVGGLHEFAERWGPRAEADDFATMPDRATFAHEFRAFPAPVSRPPHAGWTAAQYAIAPAPLTRALADGDRVDLGDRELRVLHLPGHSPGCIGLLDERDGAFYSGDAIYDDQLLDGLEGSDRAAYRATMRRLIDEIRPRIVFGGHARPFDGARMRAIAKAYLERGRA